MSHPDLILVKITDLARGGSGVAKLDSGEIIFVPFTAPGDEVKIRITKKNKNYSHGEIVEIVTPAADREKPPCPVFQKCGGCSWQHLPYSLQFETKKKGLIQALNRAGLGKTVALPEPESLPAKTIYHYRNRIQLRGNPLENSFGFYARESNEIVSVEKCEIAHPQINESLPKLKQQASKKFKRPFKLEVEFDDNGQIQAAWDQKHAAFGFRQIHSEQNEVLKNWVKSAAMSGATTNNSQPPQERVLFDFYGGDGNLSRPLMAEFSEIHCVDLSSPEQNPKKAAERHFFYHRKTVTNWLHNTKRESFQNKAITVIFDPPREGLGNDFAEILEQLSSLSLESLILVGCDADSFARDVYRFTQNGFAIQRLAVLDLFPQTPHVESLALLIPSALI